MIDLHFIDHISSNGNSFLHKANVITKTIFILLTIPLLISANSIELYIYFLILLFFVSFMAHLPIKKLLHWLFYPLFFTSFFSISLYFNNNINLSFLVLLRSLSISFMMLMFICTTQLASLFSIITFFAGKTLTAIFFVTYRYFFVISDILDEYILAFKVRGGGLKSIFTQKSQIANIFGVMFIYALENLEMLDKIMIARGFNGQFSKRISMNFSINDAFIISSLFLILICYMVI